MEKEKKNFRKNLLLSSLFLALDVRYRGRRIFIAHFVWFSLDVYKYHKPFAVLKGAHIN